MAEQISIRVDAPDRGSYETPTLTLYGTFSDLTQVLPFRGSPGSACIALANEYGDPIGCSIS